MSSKSRRSTTLTISILIVGVALAAYAFMPVSTFAAEPENGTISSPPAQDFGGDQVSNSTMVNGTPSTNGQTPDNNESQQQQQTPDNNESQQQQQTPDNNENPLVTNTTASNTDSAVDNEIAAAHADSSVNNTNTRENSTAGDSKTIEDFNRGSSNDKTSVDNKSNGGADAHKLHDLNKVSNYNNNKEDGSNIVKHEKKLYDDSKNYQGPKYYKYKHDAIGEQGDRNDGHAGEYYNSHQKKFFRYKHDFNYYDNVRIIIHHFYFKDFAGADFFVHFDYEYHRDGQVQIFFDHPFMDHSYDKEGRFYYDDEGNEFQCDQYFQGSVYYEFEHAFYKCEDLTASADFQGGY
jgi:hypothetical protein